MGANKTNSLTLLLGVALAAPTAATRAQQAPADSIMLAPVEVLGGATAATAYYEGDGSGATRTDTLQREVPQSVRVLPRQALDDVGAMRLDDSLDYVSGVARQNDFGGAWDNFAIRGFTGHEDAGLSLLRNGFPSNRGFNAPRDTANVERIEFLKGPSAALYGSSEPGGTVNIVTKKPQFEAAHTAGVFAGSYDFYRATVDIAGPLGAGFAYRLNVAVEDKGSFRDHVDSKRHFVAPALTWVLSDRTLLSYDGEYLRRNAPLDRGVVALNGKTDTVPRENFFGDPNDGDRIQENHTHQLTLEHELSARWRGRLGLAYKHTTLESTGSEVRPFVDVTGDSVTLRRRYVDFASDDVTVQGELHGKLDLGGMRHTVLIGAEAYRYGLDMLIRQQNNSMRIDDIRGKPVYTTLASGVGALIRDRREEQDNVALFAQDEIGLTERWKLLTGLRYDRYRQEMDNRLDGSTTRQTQSAVSPRAGLTYLIDRQWSWYATAGKSFRPNAGVDAHGNAFDPEEGRALETGVKFESADGRLGATLAVFQIDKKNVLTGSDPNGGYALAAGKARSRGVEFDLAGQLTAGLRLSASYAYVDAEVTRDAGGAVDWWTGQVVNLEGKALSNVPRHSASVFAMWEAAFADGGAWGLGGGVTCVGKRSGNYIGSFTLPSYTTVQLSAYWYIDRHWRLSLNAHNLFDREYIASSYDRAWLTPGAPRTVTLGMQVSF